MALAPAGFSIFSTAMTSPTLTTSRGARAGVVLDSATVARTVRDHAPAVKGCYDAAIGKKHAPTGRLIMAWTINAAGKVDKNRLRERIAG